METDVDIVEENRALKALIKRLGHEPEEAKESKWLDIDERKVDAVREEIHHQALAQIREDIDNIERTLIGKRLRELDEEMQILTKIIERKDAPAF
jgi:hypothetical protein